MKMAKVLQIDRKHWKNDKYMVRTFPPFPSVTKNVALPPCKNKGLLWKGLTLTRQQQFRIAQIEKM